MKKYWSVKEAIKYAGNLGISLSEPTMRKYCALYKLGHQLGNGAPLQFNKWYVNVDKFISFIDGKEKKLEKKTEE